jgi:hypothetical protein
MVKWQTPQEMVDSTIRQRNENGLQWWKRNGLTVADVLDNHARINERCLDNPFDNYRASHEYHAKAYREAAAIVRQAR